jgi:hypothetical protein
LPLLTKTGAKNLPSKVNFKVSLENVFMKDLTDWTKVREFYTSSIHATIWDAPIPAIFQILLKSWSRRVLSVIAWTN